MALNSAKNFAISSVANAILIGDSTITLVGGGGALFPIAQTPPATSFYATVYNAALYADPSLDPNVEIVLVTNNASNVLTVTRGQQGTSAAAHPNTSAVLAGVTRSDLALIASGIGDYALDTGSANAYVTAIDLYPSALSVGMQASVKIANTNTGASTLNHAGTGVKTITRNNGSSLQSNDLLSGMITPHVGSANLAFATNVQLVGKVYGASPAAITSIVLSGSLATVTQTAHPYATGDVVVIAGATGQTGVNALWVITKTGANSYTFVTVLTGSVTGSPAVSFWFTGTRCLNPTKVANIVRTAAGKSSLTFTSAQADGNYGISLAGTISGAATVYVTVGGEIAVPSTTGFQIDFINGTTTADGSWICIQLVGII